MTQNFINQQITIANEDTHFLENSKKVKIWLHWYHFNFNNEWNCVIIKLPYLIKEKTGTDKRDYINCESIYITDAAIRSCSLTS